MFYNKLLLLALMMISVHVYISHQLIAFNEGEARLWASIGVTSIGVTSTCILHVTD